MKSLTAVKLVEFANSNGLNAFYIDAIGSLGKGFKFNGRKRPTVKTVPVIDKNDKVIGKMTQNGHVFITNPNGTRLVFEVCPPYRSANYAWLAHIYTKK